MSISQVSIYLLKSLVMALESHGSYNFMSIWIIGRTPDAVMYFPNSRVFAFSSETQN